MKDTDEKKAPVTVAVLKVEKLEEDVKRLTTELSDARTANKSRDRKIADLKEQVKERNKTIVQIGGVVKTTLAKLDKSGALVPISLGRELGHLEKQVEDAIKSQS